MEGLGEDVTMTLGLVENPGAVRRILRVYGCSPGYLCGIYLQFCTYVVFCYFHILAVGYTAIS